MARFCHIFFLLLCCIAVAQEKTSSHRLTPTVQAVSQALPWVVNIGTESMVKVNDGYEDFFEEFFGFRLRRARQKVVKEYSPLGSGIIVDARGFILTNLHVVKRARSIEIRLWNGESYNGELIGFDAPNDLCLIRMISKQPLPTFKAAVFAKPDDVMLGETVLTIGNPFGLEHSVSQGLLSAVNRSYADDSYPFNDILQTDAAINPGNSGGPLINLDGELIGINQAIRRNASGIGFAIPIKRIEQFLSHWLLPCRFSNAYLGISPSTQLETGSKGVILTDILPDSPAARAGIKSKDEVIAVNNQPVKRLLDFGRAICQIKKGESVKFTMADNRQLKITAETMPPALLLQVRLGIQTQKLTPTLCEALNLTKDSEGIVITELSPEPLFVTQNETWREVVKRGDIITDINDKHIRTPEELAAYMANAKSGASITLKIVCFQHQGQPLQVWQVPIILY